MTESKPTRATVYKKIAITLAVVGVVVLAATLIAYYLGLNAPLSKSSTDWGTFGDFVGGVAGTAIALATLVALVIAMQLQAKELEETRRALQEQVEATREQAASVRGYETRRVRPILKAEWLPEGSQRIFWQIKNVGLGTGILDRIDLYALGKRVASHDFDDEINAQTAWKAALKSAMTSVYMGDARVRIGSVHHLIRPLAAGDSQRFVTLLCEETASPHSAMALLNVNLRAVIHFRSLANEKLNTDVQFDVLDERPEHWD